MPDLIQGDHPLSRFAQGDVGVKLFRRRLISWFRENGRDLPWRRTTDPYAILVSEMMLQQTQVATVLPFFLTWMQLFPDVNALAAAREADVLNAWQGLGYYARARNLHRAAKVVVEKHAGVFPREAEQLRTLPGIGRYTAGAVATFAFDQPAAVVDANVARVLARLTDLHVTIDSGAGQRALWSCAAALQPRKSARLFNSALMELGALVCVPREPDCPSCPVRGMCRATDPGSLPRKKPRRKTERLTETCVLIATGSAVLLQQETGRRWRGLWRLPPAEGGDRGVPLIELEYPFTHHRVTLKVFSGAPAEELGPNQRWFSHTELPAMPSPHRRALLALLSPAPPLDAPAHRRHVVRMVPAEPLRRS